MNHLKVTTQTFGAAALELFRLQASECEPYARWIELLGVDPKDVDSIDKIPYMPIELFKTHTIYSAAEPARVIFTSSGTTSDQTSRHHVPTIEEYRDTFRAAFSHFYGPASDYSIFALLPSYMERSGSSLTYMVEDLHNANPTRGGFYLYDHQGLVRDIREAALRGERVMLFGVSFALLDLAEMLDSQALFQEPLPYPPIIIETGGMKGRRREVTRRELHDTLCRAFGVDHIESEYGMTELLSQAYSRRSDARFECPPWMRLTLRDEIDAMSPAKANSEGSTVGAVNIIDLANRHSCAFIATQDRGRITPGQSGVEILGRVEQAQLRGCNMLIES